MPETWMVDECRRQVILCLACATHAGTADGPGRPPEPLFAPESVSVSRLREVATEVRGRGLGCEAIRERMDGLFSADAATPAGVPEAWTYAELIGWWLQAGEALRGLPPAVAKQYDTMLSSSAGSYPPFWCLSRFERLHFSFDAWWQSANTAAGLGPYWCGLGKTERKHRLHLLEWVLHDPRPRPGRPDPARLSQEWLEHVKQEFAAVLQDATELLGSEPRLESGGPPTGETVREWTPFWHSGQFPGGILNVVRQPVIHGGSEKTAVIKGLVMLPRPAQICRRIASTAEGGDTALVGRQAALAFATTCWSKGNAVELAATLPPAGAWRHSADGGTPTLAADDLDAGLSSVARLLTWIEARQHHGATVEGSAGPLQALEFALAMTGFSLQSEPATVGAGNRTIPRAGPAASDGAGKLTLRVALHGAGAAATGWIVDVGLWAAPAVCGDRLLAAIEALDWRIWALGVAPFADDVSRRRKALLELIDHRGWEAVKRRALAAEAPKGGEAAIARLFEHAHRARLGIRLLLDGSEDATDRCLGGRLLDDLDELCRIALAEAAVIGEQALGAFSPPRRPDGKVQVVKWLRQRLKEPDSAGPGLTWKAHESAFGTAFGERVDEHRRLSVDVSAGSAGDREIAFLNAPLPTVDGEAEKRSLQTVLAGFQARLIEAIGKATTGAIDVELAELRSRFAGGDAAAFHDLIARSLAGDSAAARWLDLLAADEGFDFCCHPPLAGDHRQLTPPGIDDVYLAWADDPTLPAGADIDVRFAIDPRQARRVISRGPRHTGSIADLADMVFAAASGAGRRLEGAAAACRDATDRWLLFGDAADHPVKKAGPVLEAILEAHDASAEAKQAVFAAVSRWCAELGHQVLPDEWRAGESLPAERFADIEVAPVFDEVIPAGDFMLRRFGLLGEHGQPLEGAVSAGPAPAGFNDLRAALNELGSTPDLGHTPKLADLGNRLQDFARQAASGRLPMVVPNLFDGLWGAAEAAPAALRAAFEPAKGHLLQLLKSSCRMVVFEPAKLTDHPAEWIVGPDGKRPAGNRIRKIVRPGIRTLSSSLVRPAIVETE